jgi:glycosyltransferase involved in cell wall biosynthesis
MQHDQMNSPVLPLKKEADIEISIVVCTYNRVERLVNIALNSLLLQKLEPGCGIEILVVDNASTDNTREQVMDFMKKYPQLRLRYIYEGDQGLSHARNRGIIESQSDIIAFLDDDAEATPEWVQNLIDAYHRHLDAWAVGGKTLPVCDEPRPIWFQGRMLRLLGGHDLGIEERLLPKTLYLQGANMSFKRKVFEVLGNFRPELGRIGNKNLSHEEGELFWRIHSAGKPIYYVPSVLVHHRQPIERLNFHSMMNVRFFCGISEALADKLHFGWSFTILRAVRRIGFSLVVLLPCLLLLLIGDHTNAYYLFLRSVFGVGYLVGVLHQFTHAGGLSKYQFPA